MSYIGDFAEDYATLNTKFTTVNGSGVPTQLAGTPAISVYKANGTTQTTAGITLSVDFDSVTGLNNVLIDLSADAFYATGNDYQIVITTGTVDGNSVVGYVVGEFSIENRFMRGTDSAATSSALATAQADLDTITGSDGATLATAQGNYAPAKASDILTTALTEAYAADGAEGTLTQILYMIQQSVQEFAITSTTRTVKKLDGSTTAATFTLDDATSPTSTTRAT